MSGSEAPSQIELVSVAAILAVAVTAIWQAVRADQRAQVESDVPLGNAFDGHREQHEHDQDTFL